MSTTSSTATLAPAGSSALPAVLWPMLFGNFVIGTGVMAVPGTLNDISSSLAVSVATAGQLISAGAVLMALGAPLCAALVAGWDRRRLLALSMLWYALLRLENCICTPHIGYVEQESYELYFGAAFDNVVNYIRGTPTNIVNPGALQVRR